MYGSEDLERFYVEYQSEWVPRGMAVRAYEVFLYPEIRAYNCDKSIFTKPDAKEYICQVRK